ncbi:MAG: ABC transporter permease [Sciscionella sp.]
MIDQQSTFRPTQGILLVAGREISTRLRSKPYVVVTIILALIVVALAVVLKLISGGGPSVTSIGIVKSSTAVSSAVRASGRTVGETLRTQPVSSPAQGKQLVRNGKLDAVISPNAAGVRVIVSDSLSPTLRSAMTVLSRQLALDRQISGLGGDPAAVSAAVGQSKVSVQSLAPPKSYNPQNLVLGIVAGVLIYLSLLLNGQLIAQGVVEEKTSRVVELLLSAIRPWQLMAGKVLGIGAVGLLQMLIIAVAGVAAGLGLGVLTISVSAAIGTVVWLVVWFLLGFTAYALVFAGLGALVSRQEDVGGVVTPALMLVIAGYVVGISILPSDPSNTFVEVLSLIPAFSPTLMPMRLAIGGVPTWETVFSVVVTAALIPVLVRVTGRMYGNAVMRSGARVKLGQALRGG